MKINRLNLTLFLLILFFAKMSYAEIPETVDIYGTTQISALSIKNKYQQEFNQIAEIMQSPTGLNSKLSQKHYLSAATRIMSGIKSMGDFLQVQVSPIVYQDDAVTHFTIDIVENKDKYRLSYFAPQPRQSLPDPDHLLATWSEYEKTGFAIFYRERKFPKYQSCPAQHCLFGFEHPALQKYQKIFNDTVPKDQSQLVNILKNDKDAAKRATAAFLLAHIKNINELFKILIPSINDPDEQVRNNVMRVIGMALLKTPKVDVPIQPVVNALNFPKTTDRNKALLIIFTLVDQPKYASYVTKRAGSYLLNLLKLQQPDNHDLAYAILQKISGKKYAERDYPAWTRWVNTCR